MALQHEDDVRTMISLRKCRVEIADRPDIPVIALTMHTVQEAGRFTNETAGSSYQVVEQASSLRTIDDVHHLTVAEGMPARGLEAHATRNVTVNEITSQSFIVLAHVLAQTQ